MAIFSRIKNWLIRIRETKGTVALILVVMITSLTLVSAVVIALINISERTADFHISETVKVQASIDSCLDDALLLVSRDVTLTGNYEINIGNIICEYWVGAEVSGIKIVTTTATTTSDIGDWTRSIVTEINVDNSPMLINSYKDVVN